MKGPKHPRNVHTAHSKAGVGVMLKRIKVLLSHFRMLQKLLYKANPVIGRGIFNMVWGGGRGAPEQNIFK